MKVTLDLDQLLADGKITRAEYDRLGQLGSAGTGSLAFNILIGFGVIAVAGGLIALSPNAITGIVIGGGILAAGLGLMLARNQTWAILSHICVLVGALMLGGGLVILGEASVATFLAVAAGFGVIGVMTRSGLLVALAVLALSSSVGARTGYMHATYLLGIEEPTITIVLFSVLALVVYQVSRRVPHLYEGVAIAAARTSIFLVNFGFWIGSLWGDEVPGIDLAIPDFVFAIVWAVALVATAVWAVRAGRRWLLNVLAIFGAIHFYTQWFEILGAQPLTVLIAGLIALGLAVGLWRLNRDLFKPGGLRTAMTVVTPPGPGAGSG